MCILNQMFINKRKFFHCELVQYVYHFICRCNAANFDFCYVYVCVAVWTLNKDCKTQSLLVDAV